MGAERQGPQAGQTPDPGTKTGVTPGRSRHTWLRAFAVILLLAVAVVAGSRPWHIYCIR